MTDVHASIAAALESRRAYQESIDRLYRTWCAMAENIGALTRTIGATSRKFAELRQQAPDSVSAAGVADGSWNTNDLEELGRIITELTPDIEAIWKRFRRPTVNIGVVGRPKAGKSTLLRTITGLGEEAIPVSEHNPTTAARSRIQHAQGRADAEIILRTWDEFRDGYLGPLHNDARLEGPVPFTPDEFLEFPYQRLLLDSSRSQGDAAIDKQKFLQRLLTAQYSFASYRDYLEQPERKLTVGRLADLRPFVAYPQEDSPVRPYHAVRDVWIYCNFDVTDVENLVLVDLPGAGEAALDIERQFLADLKNEVDVLLQVKHPGRGEAFITDEDWRVLNLADAARMGVERADFITFVINSDPDHVQKSARENAERMAHKEITDRNKIRLLVGNAADPAEVREKILGPVLEGLAQHLAAMDRKAAATQIARASAVAERALTVADRLAEEVGRRETQIPDEEQVLSRAAKRLRSAVGKQLDDLRKEYARLAQEHEPVPELDQAIARARENLSKWADTGFGAGSKGKWLTVVEEDMAVDPGETRDDQCTLARQKIREEFGQIDTSLISAVDRLHEAVADVLRGRLTSSLIPANERPLHALRETACQSRLKTLCSALDELLEVRASYGNAFLRVGGPIVMQVRPVGGRVSGEHTPGPAGHQTDHQTSGTGGSLYNRARKAATVAGAAHVSAVGAAHPVAAATVATAQVAAAAAPLIAGWIWQARYNDDSAAGLHEALSHAFGEAVKQIDERMREEAGQLTEVLAAAMSQFFDRFARTPDVEDEWAELCRPFSEELWPELFGREPAVLAAGLSQIAGAVSASDAAARNFLAAAVGIGP